MTKPDEKPTTDDPVNPRHYRGDRVMQIIEEFELGFCPGNVVKYLLRYKEKGGLTDLKKASWYLDREIKHLEKIASLVHDRDLEVNKIRSAIRDGQ